MVGLSFFDVLNDPDWDAAFFKRLADNDTGSARGHQGGLVIPKDLRVFFPTLAGTTSAVSPTVDNEIEAVLFVDGAMIDRVTTRYQHQTWGGQRRPETRLTRNLAAIRNQATGGDYLVFQRSVNNLYLYRLVLLRQGTRSHSEFADRVGGRRWGTLGPEPLSQTDLDEAVTEMDHKQQQAFVLFEQKVKITETRLKRMARAEVFRFQLLRIYSSLCCVCRSGLRSPDGKAEVEASHIVPRSQLGADDPRNGLVFCRAHHWAFDNFLFGINTDGVVTVGDPIAKVPENKLLAEMHGTKIARPSLAALSPHPDALKWHLAEMTRKWGSSHGLRPS